jgi:alpha,alpha-trehalase
MDLVDLMLQRTRAYWMLWSARTHLPLQYRRRSMRSALVLKMLQFSPTGAFLAAATTSLPETIGEERNWDYRFCWLRDASMTVTVLHRIGHSYMATAFIDWMMKTVPTKDDSLQIMYGIRGEKELTERILDHFSGYQGSRRCGSATRPTPRNNMISSEWCWMSSSGPVAAPAHPEASTGSGPRCARSCAWSVAWPEPDRGIWEIRGEKRHFVFSKVLCWVAVDRAIRIAELLDKHEWAARIDPLLMQIHEDICRRGWNEAKGAFVQAYGSTDLDASNLLLAEFGFIEPAIRVSWPRWNARRPSCAWTA